MARRTGRAERSGLGGLWLLAPLACCGGPLLIAGLAAAGALAWGGVGLAVAVLLTATALIIRRRRRSCRPGRPRALTGFRPRRAGQGR